MGYLKTQCIHHSFRHVSYNVINKLYLAYSSLEPELERFEAGFVLPLTILVIKIVRLHMAPESG